MIYKKFALFFVLFFTTVLSIQVFIYKSEDPVSVLIIKDIITGIVVSGVFVLLTRKAKTKG